MSFGNGVLYVLIFMKYGLSLEGLIFGIFSTVLLEILIIDWNLYLIPIECNIIILSLGIVRFFVFQMSFWMHLLGPFLLGGCLVLIYYLTKKKAIGGGDIKFIIVSGILLGVERAFIAFFFAGIMAISFYITKSVMGRRDRLIALGPYLAIGSFAVLLFEM